MKLPTALAPLLSLTLLASLTTCTHPTPKTPTTLPTATATTQPKPRPRGRLANNPNNAPALQPETRKDKSGNTDPAWLAIHETLVAQAKNDHINLLFIGDANTQRWSTTGKTVWQSEFSTNNPANFGIPGDTTQQILWRLQNGELPSSPPKVIILSAGANNRPNNTPEQTARSLASIINYLQQKSPASNILLLAILPRNGPTDPQRIFDDAVNTQLASIADRNHIKFLNPSKDFLNPNNTLNEKLYENDTYLTEPGYQTLAAAIKPTLEKWLKK